MWWTNCSCFEIFQPRRGRGVLSEPWQWSIRQIMVANYYGCIHIMVNMLPGNPHKVLTKWQMTALKVAVILRMFIIKTCRKQTKESINTMFGSGLCPSFFSWRVKTETQWWTMGQEQAPVVLHCFVKMHNGTLWKPWEAEIPKDQKQFWWSKSDPVC